MQATRGELVQESFDRALDVLRQLGIFRESPKLFIIYAHENKESELDAHQETVKNYITWFKQILFNVDSDKSPHGYGLVHKPAHTGAGVNIINNQICLLPTSWHKENMDYVLLFYSKLLAEYLKDEREFKVCDETYSKAIFNVCKKYEVKRRVSVNEICKEISTVQEKYLQKMGSLFHHVLTETALLSFRNQGPGTDSTIPIMFSGDKDWERELQWKSDFVYTTETQIRITIEPGKEYQHFFKILLMFESLEVYRRPIEAMRNCFDDCVKLLEVDVQPEEYRVQLDIHIWQALQSLNEQWPMIERPLTPGHIRDRLNLYSKLDCESIRRISGDRLLGTFNDVELAVTERLGSEGEGPVMGQQRRSENVPLHGLFDQREVGTKTIKPQRILIQGRPGIGKTTLCRRLMYEYSWDPDLRTKFHLVVRIPVGKLGSSADLNNLLFEEYFHTVSRGHDLSNQLGSLILDHENANLESKTASSVNILIILDGLDETRRLSHEKRTLLETLIRRPAVIITSRSHDTDMLYKSVDLHLEAIGLSTVSVDAYLDNEEIVPRDTATEIHGFIKSNPSVKDMVRVPIHLDILCYSWNEIRRQNTPTKFRNETDEGENVSPSITALYQAVVCSLWRKDIPELGKQDHGEPVTVEVINAVRNSTRLERLVDTESKFLEQLANLMMESDRLECTDKDIAEAIQYTESNDNLLPLSLERNIQRLSLLRSYPSERHRKYRFVHLTFQEFFAARYLTRQVARERASFRTLLMQHKYNRRYEKVWMFFAGLLLKVEELEFFFGLLDDEPRDLVGVQHIWLFMHCLSECQIRIRPRRWKAYQRRLIDWVRLESRIFKLHGISFSMAFPERIILEALLPDSTSMSPRLELILLSLISDRNSLSESLIQEIAQLILKDEEPWVVGSQMTSLLKIGLGFVDQGTQMAQITLSLLGGQIREDLATLPADFVQEFVEALCETDNESFGLAQGLLQQHLDVHSLTVDIIRDFSKNDKHKDVSSFEERPRSPDLLDSHPEYEMDLKGIKARIRLVWMIGNRERIVANLDLFKPEITCHILETLLHRSVESLTPAYINGKTLYSYAADGKLTEKTLKDEKAFRENFREGQRLAGFPEWACVNLLEGSEEQNPMPGP